MDITGVTLASNHQNQYANLIFHDYQRNRKVADDNLYNTKLMTGDTPKAIDKMISNLPRAADNVTIPVAAVRQLMFTEGLTGLLY